MLEVAYTRVVSYKLFYYYTYLVIGLALLGIGSGGIAVALYGRIRQASTQGIVAVCSVLGAVTIALGYVVVAKIHVDTLAVWDYGSGRSIANMVRLGTICFVLFASFVAIGIIIATLLGRAGSRIGRVYFADLIGAALGCMLAIPLISRYSPPRLVYISAFILALVGIMAAVRWRGTATIVAAGVAVAVLVPAVGTTVAPYVVPEAGKHVGGPTHPGTRYWAWGPVFRVDVVQLSEGAALLLHDGLFGSGIYQFDGDAASLTRYDSDPRAVPFRVLGAPPRKELIIGSAGGNEILASIYNKAPDIEAVELNPVTVSILRDHFADYTGHIATRPGVHLHQGDGRSYLARTDSRYDLVWFAAPDSYAANNAASSGAFVLSESYLYTTEMIQDTLRHLTDDGIMVVQFGDLDFENRPNRSARYIVTARDALEQLGVEQPANHILVAANLTGTGDLANIIVKRTPFTNEEIARFTSAVADLPEMHEYYAPGRPVPDHPVSQAAGAQTPDELENVVSSYPLDISAVTDNKPFFWHFESYRDVLGDSFHSLQVRDSEEGVGERVLLLLLAVAILYAGAFLLAPFLTVREKWSAFPHKAVSGVYFAALGLGFMFFEITMIQRFARFLGYPTYSLTVTLAALLVSTGIGALVSSRVGVHGPRAAAGALVVLAVLTAFYQLGLDDLLDDLQSWPLAGRIAVVCIVLLPLGLCLGLFMPLGLATVRQGAPDPEAYVAWCWAINGFFSVIGSALTAILSMTYGFRAVQWSALAVYVVAVLALFELTRRVVANNARWIPAPAAMVSATSAGTRNLGEP
jgi:hypothetical protein